MNNEQLLGQMPKREVAFRMFCDCLHCEYVNNLHQDKQGRWFCTGNEQCEDFNRAGFEGLMVKEVGDLYD
jgi:hypothetical protein